MAQDNIGVFTNPAHNLRVGPCEPAVDYQCEPDEALIHVRSTGICASDVHFWHEGRVGDTMVVRGEHILGHESSGDIIAVGSKVTNVKVGDRVAIEPGVSCLICDRCTGDKYRGCEKVAFKSTPPYPGLLRRYVPHPARLCHPIGDMSYELGALLEPVSVGLMGQQQSGMKLGDVVLVCGAGPIGITSAVLARAAGAAPLVITDMVQDRLDMAVRMVPGIRTVLVKRDDSSQDVAARIIETAGQRPTVGIECTGFESSINAAIFALDFGSVLEVIGVGKDYINIPFMHASVNEIAIRGLFRYSNTWPRAIRLVNDRVIDPSDLVTHRYKLEDAVSAFNKFIEPGSGAVKVMIQDGL